MAGNRGYTDNCWTHYNLTIKLKSGEWRFQQNWLQSLLTEIFTLTIQHFQYTVQFPFMSISVDLCLLRVFWNWWRFHFSKQALNVWSIKPTLVLQRPDSPVTFSDKLAVTGNSFLSTTANINIRLSPSIKTVVERWESVFWKSSM